MKPIPITESVYWIGENDRETDYFEALWPLPYGISYNSYAIVDDKVALVEAVKKNFLPNFVDRIRQILKDGKQVDYLIINHMEPDHSGAVKILPEIFPRLQIIGNKKTAEMLSGFFGFRENVRTVADGDTLDLGRHRLSFHLTPMVNWPETMMTYDETDKILFSGDAFGGFGALGGTIFDDEVDRSYFESETLRYFSNIIARYSGMVLKAIDKVAGLDIRVVAPSHGPIWRAKPRQIIEDYARWSRNETEPGVVIAYGSMYGHTETLADTIARALAEKGVPKVYVHNVTHSHASYIIRDIWRCKGLILGSPTYNTMIFPLMDYLVRLLENKMIKDRLLGIFGSHSWGGGAVKGLREFAERGKWELVEPVVEVKHAPMEEDLEQCRLLGENMAKAL